MKTMTKTVCKRIMALFTATSLSMCIFSGCSKKKEDNTENNTTITSITTTVPSVPTTTVSEETTVISEQVENGEIDDIYSMVCSFANYELSNAGFTVGNGVAYTEDDRYTALGLYYYDDNIKLFETKNDDVHPVGFVEIVDENADFFQADEIEDLIYVDAVDESDNNTEMLCLYNYADIGSSHFVYQHKYVTFYQETSMRIVYTAEDIDCDDVYDFDGYDISLGSIFDYDNNQYIYDESLFVGEDNYVTHTSVGLFDDPDYARIEQELADFSNNQLQAGCTIEELSIVYISPENIQTYLDSEEEDTFFGYSVSDITAAFGENTALEYKNGKFEEASFVQSTPEEYDWKGFLAKVGIGTGLSVGVVVVTAVVAPELIKVSIPMTILLTVKDPSLLSVLPSIKVLVQETGNNLLKGKSLKDAILGSTGKALDAFSDSYILMSMLCNIKPVAKLIQYKAVGAEAANSMSTQYLRQKAVNKAWEKEVKAIQAGKSNYNWTDSQKAELLANGKVEGYDGHHIKTVKELEDTVSKWLIGDSDDIVFLSESEHLYVHGGNTQNATDMVRLLKLHPWVIERMPKLLIAS